MHIVIPVIGGCLVLALVIVVYASIVIDRDSSMYREERRREQEAVDKFISGGWSL